MCHQRNVQECCFVFVTQTISNQNRWAIKIQMQKQQFCHQPVSWPMSHPKTSVLYFLMHPIKGDIGNPCDTIGFGVRSKATELIFFCIFPLCFYWWSRQLYQVERHIATCWHVIEWGWMNIQMNFILVEIESVDEGEDKFTLLVQLYRFDSWWAFPMYLRVISIDHNTETTKVKFQLN